MNSWILKIKKTASFLKLHNNRSVFLKYILIIILIVASVIIIDVEKYNYYIIFTTGINQAVLLMLLPIILLILSIRIVGRKEITLTALSIFIAIFFFLFQNTLQFVNKTQENIKLFDSTRQAILATNLYNYSVAKNYGEETDLRGKVPTIPYITDIYKNNITFIYNHFGTDTGNILMEITAQMNRVNILSQFVQELNIQAINKNLVDRALSSIVMYNTEIEKNSAEIEENLIKLNNKLFVQ